MVFFPGSCSNNSIMEIFGGHVMPAETFNYLLEKECKHAVRYEHFFSIAMIHSGQSDLGKDHLSQLISLITREIRECDVMGDLRGERLCVIFHQTDNIREIMDRLLSKLRGKGLRFSLKFSGAVFPTDAATSSDLLVAAQLAPSITAGSST
jgi:GGDEF domain-containing protein